MERVERLLREELQRADAAVPPSREGMLARVARARRRRRRTAVAGASFSVIGAIAAIVVVSSIGPAGTQAGAGFQARSYTTQLINVVFTDHNHGYALKELCSVDNPPIDLPDDAPTPDVHWQCVSQLQVTADAGHSWQERDLPGDPATKDAGFDLMLGHSLMLWAPAPGTVALGGWDRKYWTTSDLAASWHESATPRAVGPMAWFGPHDELTVLATSPPGFTGPTIKRPWATGADGSFWTVAGEGTVLQLTRDRGQTWQDATPLETATLADWVSTFDGQTVYASVAVGNTPHLMRSTDGGATWTEVFVNGLQERTYSGLVLASGDVLMSREGEVGGMFRLRSGATAVEQLPTAPAHMNALFQTAGVVVAAPAWHESDQPDSVSVAFVSPDNGTTWLPVP
jgi:hypothetical protein